MTVSPRTPKRIGIAADHGGCELKYHLVKKLQEAGYAECFNCRAVVAPAAQASPDYRVGASCPSCVATPFVGELVT